MAVGMEARITKNTIFSSSLRLPTITIKIRWSNFTTITRQKTVPGEIHKSGDIYKVAKSLLYENWEPGKPIRLLGVSASRLGVSDQQKLKLEFE